MPGRKDFFNHPAAHTLAKSGIVADYFARWAAKLVQSPAGKIVYLDLFCGPGEFDDGTPSTPLLVLRTVLNPPPEHRQRLEVRKRLLERLQCVYNDVDPQHVEQLKEKVEALANYTLLAHKPLFYTRKVEQGGLAKWRMVVGEHPTLLFFDPYGYKEVDLQGIDEFIGPYGSECILFLNYHALRRAASNPLMSGHVKEVLGGDAVEKFLASDDEDSTPDANEAKRIILQRIKDRLTQRHGRYVLPFELATEQGSTFHIVHVTKRFEGHDLMRDRMARHSVPEWSPKSPESVPSFQYVEKSQLWLIAPSFFQGRTIDALARSLLEASGEYSPSISFKELYERHSPGRLYVKQNYKAAVRLLVERGEARVEKDGSEYSRKKLQAGKLPDACVIVWNR